MSVEDDAKAVLDKLGLHWPDGDPDKLRLAATAWRTFAGRVDDVRTPVDHAAKTLIHHNKGEAIEKFETFWGRYVGKGEGGWLKDLPKSAREMAHALDQLADAIDEAVHKLWTEIGISAAVIAGGFVLGFVTFGATDAAAVAAADGVIALGETLGVTISTTVARIAAGALVGYAFGGVESVVLDSAVAQPLRMAAGEQKGFSLDEVNEAAKTGSIYGAVFGGAFAGVGGKGPLAPGAAKSPELFRVPSLRENLIGKLPCRIRNKIPKMGEPVDIASGAMLMEQVDLELPASLPLVVERTHVSSYRAGTCFGPSWVSTLDERIQLDAGGVVFAAADGMRLEYPVPEPGVAVLPGSGVRWPLEWDGKPDGVMTITDPESGVVRTFSHPGLSEDPTAVQLPLESWQDRNGARIEVERDAAGTPTALRHSGGYYVAVDSEGPRVTALRLLDEPPSAYEPESAPGRGTVVMRYAYDEAGNLAEVINSSGKPLRFTYDDEHRMLSWTDRNGTSFAYEYDEAGRVVRTAGSDGIYNGTFDYDTAPGTTLYTDSHGQRTVCRYNDAGLLTSKTDPLGHTTRTEWNAHGTQPLSVTDQLGHVTRYTVDEDDNLTAVTLPDHATAHATYNPLGQPVEVTEPGGAVWRHAYDPLGNLTSTTDPAGAETRYTYDERHHPASVTDALGNTRHITNDPAGLPSSVTDALGHETLVRRDPFGRITEITDPLGNSTRMGWTTEGKPSWREEPNGARESWTWDGEGNLLTHTTPAGHTTTHTYAPFDVPATRTDPDGATYAFTYDTELRLTRVTNPQGLHWTYDYDAAGRTTAETDFNGHTRTYALDATGTLTSLANACGQTVHFSRDQLGRTVEQRDDSDQLTTFAYDESGDLTRATNSDAELVLTRDALGRVLHETTNGRTLSYAYDALGRCTSRTTPSGIHTQWTYDAEQRPTELRSSHGALTFVYDAAGRETERRIGSDDVALTQAWDNADRLTTQTLTTPGPDADRLLQHREYAYRSDGYLTEIRELTSGTRHFALDPTGRVTGVSAHGWTETYTYDPAGNLTHATAPDHNAPGDHTFEGTLLHRAGRTTYTHDTAGRLTRKSRKLLNGQTQTWTYTWNAEDRLTTATTPDGTEWTYAYDPLGRRIAKTEGSAPGTPTVTFVWDATRLAEQTTHNGETTTWDYTPGTHRPLTQTNHQTPTNTPGTSALTTLIKNKPTPAFHAVITDLTGTPTELVTPDGHLTWQHRTTLWGTPLPAPPNDTDCPLRFPGQYADPETGLHYNYYRHYDPETARYITPDPLGLKPAPNHHAYVHNPHTRIDPFGLEGCSPGVDDATWDEIYDKYGPRVADGVDHNFERTNDGTASGPDHSISGIGSDPHKLAEYLHSHEDKMTHYDTRRHSHVAYDNSRHDAKGRGVLIVQTPHRIHAFHYSETDFNGGRYTQR